MKNNEILLDVIGETNDELIPDITRKKKMPNIVKWAAVGSVGMAAVIAGVIILPGISNISTGGPAPQLIPGTNVMKLAAAVYPEMPGYPVDNDDNDASTFNEWTKATRALRNQPEGYKDGFDGFFAETAKTFLNGAETKNMVYSPLSLYMALGMSAEITDGNTRKQIIDLLGQENIDKLRSHSKSIWQANYMDDWMAECILATSLWANNAYTYNNNTLASVADNYYSSVFSGDPGSEDYNKAMRDWMNDQTDGLLEEYISEMKMDPEMLLTIASTVNYSGKWLQKFDEELTAESSFHSPSGDITCDFMNMFTDTYCSYGDKFRAISMNLENNGEMRLILPDEGVTPEELINDDEVFRYMMNQRNTIYTDSKHVIADISVPKFDISSSIDLNEGLKKLGVTDIFDSSQADFSPLTDSSDGIVLSKAEQDTRVMIDENGCKASSLTVMEYCGAAVIEDQVKLVYDRPFIFEIMSETGLPLFVGIVNSPV